MTLIGRWTFAGLGGPWDETENWQQVVLSGDAKLTHKGLNLKKGGRARVLPAPGKEMNISEQTLIAWLTLDDLSDKKPNGTALTLGSSKADKFNGIKFGDSFWDGSEGLWTAGSNVHGRTEKPSDEDPREVQTGKLVKIAISYADAGFGKAEIKVYRNDVLKRSYQKGKLETLTDDEIEVLFGAWRVYSSAGDNWQGYLDATIVAAEIWDEALSTEQIKARLHTDPCTFVRRSVSLEARYLFNYHLGSDDGLEARSLSNYYLSNYYLATDDGTGMKLVKVTEASDNQLKEHATLVLVPGLADPTMVSLQVYQPSGAYVVATTDGIAIERPSGTNDFRRRATFEKVPGLFGNGGWSFKSLSQPNHYLRHQDYILKLQTDDTTDQFKKDATFTEKEGLVSDLTTELPLEEGAWYLISNHKVTPNKVLAVLDDNSIGFVDLPSRPDSNVKQPPPAPDHVLWRLERLAESGLHRWKLINKKVGASKPLYTKKDGLSIGSDGHTGQRWTIRPIPWMGSDYFAMTSDWIEGDGSTLGCDADVSHTEVRAVPRIEPLNLASPKQRWRFTFMSYVDGVERPTPPERIASIYNPQGVPHDTYAKTYPQYAGALGMDYVATDSVSDWARAMARTVLTNLLLTLKDRSLIDKFKGYRILIVGDGDADEAKDYPDISFAEFAEWRGGTDNYIARITEEMMCRYGITHRPKDAEYRKYDQTIHEFGHSIDRRLGLEGELKKVQGDRYSVESFPWWVQSWFNSAIAWGEGGTRKGFSRVHPKYAAFVRKYFLENREWRPLEVNYKHGSPDVAHLSEADEQIVMEQGEGEYDQGTK